jgi:hypothetical protein
MKKRLLFCLVFALYLASAISTLAQDKEAKDPKAPKSEKHEFVIASFRTESGVVLPQARIEYGT